MQMGGGKIKEKSNNKCHQNKAYLWRLVYPKAPPPPFPPSKMRYDPMGGFPGHQSLKERQNAHIFLPDKGPWVPFYGICIIGR